MTASLWLAAAGSGRTDEVWLPVPRPDIDENRAMLRVVFAVNPRFSHMSDAQLAILLSEAQRVTKEHFGIEISFGQPK